MKKKADEIVLWKEVSVIFLLVLLIVLVTFQIFNIINKDTKKYKFQTCSIIGNKLTFDDVDSYNSWFRGTIEGCFTVYFKQNEVVIGDWESYANPS
jgi:uncharacterized membrane protein